MFIHQISCCCLTRPNLMLDSHYSNLYGAHKACVIKAIVSCLVIIGNQSMLLLYHVFTLNHPLFYTNLVTIIACYTSLCIMLILVRSIHIMWIFTLLYSVTVPWLVCYGAMTKPRASLWPAGTWLCWSACAGIVVTSHKPLEKYIIMLFSHELFPYLSLYVLSEDL